ncbi:MAG: hypothetical protein ABIP55_04305, partial [Tepidisphaeraceae bacterium]
MHPNPAVKSPDTFQSGIAGTPVSNGSAGDQLAASVLRSLSRSLRNQYSMNPVQAAGLALLTFGIAPLFKLVGQFSGYLSLESQQVWHAAEWLRTRGGGEEAEALADCAKKLRHEYNDTFASVAQFLGIATIVLVVLSMSHG